MTYVKFNNGVINKSLAHAMDELMKGIPDLFQEVSLTQRAYVPVNIRENQAGYALEVVAPGFEKSDFKINLEDNILTISAVKKPEDKTEKEKQIRREFNYRDFKRSFTIDEKIDATGIEASYVNGVLVLNLPKKKEVKEAAKEITVE